MSIGAYGVISVLSNHIPKTLNLIVKLCDENNYNEAFQLYSEVDEMIKILFSETNPSPIKYILMKFGIISTDQVRLPLVKMQNLDNMNKIVQLNNKLHAYYFSKQGKY
jgi:4-hydroxy-tetrahydrodipicolinate synthase